MNRRDDRRLLVSDWYDDTPRRTARKRQADRWRRHLRAADGAGGDGRQTWDGNEGITEAERTHIGRSMGLDRPGRWQIRFRPDTAGNHGADGRPDDRGSNGNYIGTPASTARSGHEERPGCVRRVARTVGRSNGGRLRPVAPVAGQVRHGRWNVENARACFPGGAPNGWGPRHGATQNTSTGPAGGRSRCSGRSADR